jgi:hypothetical protein
MDGILSRNLYGRQLFKLDLFKIAGYMGKNVMAAGAALAEGRERGAVQKVCISEIFRIKIQNHCRKGYDFVYIMHEKRLKIHLFNLLDSPLAEPRIARSGPQCLMRPSPNGDVYNLFLTAQT